MAYVTLDYYTGTFLGEPVSEADFPSLCVRAGEMIETLTAYRLSPERLPQLPEAVQERVKMAVCAQIEYLDANGGSDVDNGAALQSASLGKFSYSAAAGASGGTAQPAGGDNVCR